jgi:hypothetical protein
VDRFGVAVLQTMERSSGGNLEKMVSYFRAATAGLLTSEEVSPGEQSGLEHILRSSRRDESSSASVDRKSTHDPGILLPMMKRSACVVAGTANSEIERS